MRFSRASDGHFTGMSTSESPQGETRPRLHVVMAALGTSGDMYPFLALAVSLQRRGHRVTFFGPAPHERHARLAGVPFHAVGTVEDYQEALADPDLWHPQRSFKLIWQGLNRCLDLLPAFVRTLPQDEPCVILSHLLAIPSAALVRPLRPDIPIVSVVLAPSNLRTSHDPLTIGPLSIPPWVPMAWRRWIWGRVDARFLDPVALPDLNAERGRRGLPPVDHFHAHMQGASDLSVALFPAWFAPAPPDWPQPLVQGDFQLYEPDAGQPMSAELTRFLSAGEPPIVFTAGTGHRHASAYFAKAVQATRRLGARAVLLSSAREQVPASLPDSVLWQPYVPFRTLLPAAAALVHHGGIGTTAEALRAGVPQLVVPFAHDQFDNGARIQALGVGRAMPASRLRAGALARVLDGLVSSPSVKAACRVVANRFAAQASNDALCQRIEALMARPAEAVRP